MWLTEHHISLIKNPLQAAVDKYLVQTNLAISFAYGKSQEQEQ